MPDQPHTFVLVPDMWHGAWIWAGVVFELMVRGHRAVTVNLPSVGQPETVDRVDLLDDANAVIRASANAYTRYGRPVIIVGHGYGAVLVSEAVAHLGDMAAGVYYIAAPVALESTMLALIREHPLADIVRFIDEACMITSEDAFRVLYNDVTPLIATEAARLLHPMSLHALATEMLHREAWQTYPRGYMVCLADRALPGGWQAGEAHGHGCEVDQCSSGHFPQLANFGYVADRLTAFAQRHFRQAA
jgi:pimeloyl-ACP methyl ester carboxylesterase